MMQPAKAAHGAFLARRKLAASGSSRAPCAFPTLAVQRVREVVDALPEEDAALLRALYLQTPPLTLRAYSEKTGIPVMTLHYRKAASAFEAANLSQML